MADLKTWAVQGIHEHTSNVEVCVVNQVPAGGRLDGGCAVTVEVLFASRSFLMPEQARHLASVLTTAAASAET